MSAILAKFITGSHPCELESPKGKSLPKRISPCSTYIYAPIQSMLMHKKENKYHVSLFSPVEWKIGHAQHTETLLRLPL